MILKFSLLQSWLYKMLLVKNMVIRNTNNWASIDSKFGKGKDWYLTILFLLMMACLLAAAINCGKVFVVRNWKD